MVDHIISKELAKALASTLTPGSDVQVVAETTYKLVVLEGRGLKDNEELYVVPPDPNSEVDEDIRNNFSEGMFPPGMRLKLARLLRHVTRKQLTLRQCKELSEYLSPTSESFVQQLQGKYSNCRPLQVNSFTQTQVGQIAHIISIATNYALSYEDAAKVAQHIVDLW
jgi:hypothetical protein